MHNELSLHLISTGLVILLAMNNVRSSNDSFFQIIRISSAYLFPLHCCDITKLNNSVLDAINNLNFLSFI